MKSCFLPFLRCLSLVVGLCVVAGGYALVSADSGQAENHQKASRHMVTAANPHAAQAGLEILRAGGSAVDAAIAVEAVLGLVEPQSSGLGGGAFLMHYDPTAAKGERIDAYDGREMAPAAATADMFQDVLNDNSKGFYDAVLGGRSVGTPSVVAMLYLAHQKRGKLPWGDLFAPALRLAEGGFKVSPRLHYLIDRDPLLRKMKASRAYFYNADGKAWPVGHLLKNPAYVKSLKIIAKAGAAGFYHGPLAQEIVAAVQGSEVNPGKLTLEDMAAYKPKLRRPICGPYRVWTICGMPPPSSGGGTVASILGILQSFDLKAMGANSLAAVHVILEAERLAYADRDMYMADSDYVNVPMALFTDPFYLADRARQIDLQRSMGHAEAGTPPGASRIAFAAGMTPELPSTTHFSIVDQWGQMVSMTATVESAFGSRVMAGGFMLNNEMTDFSLRWERDGLPVANRIAPGKRPRSSMSPTFVLDEDRNVVMAIGSPGGGSIIAYVAQTIINVLDWDMDLQQAIDQPHFLTRGGVVSLERDTGLSALEEPLRDKGHQVRSRTVNSGLHGIIVHRGADGTWYEGAADKRREGVVVAD